MSKSDDDWGKPFFPTRFGGAQGHCNERQMLDVVGGFDSIRTRIRTNSDGSTTVLKTRGGMPIFTTTKVETVKPTQIGTPHSLVISVATDGSANFYTKDSIGAWVVNKSVLSSQKGVTAYWCGHVSGTPLKPVVVGLTTSGVVDLGARALPGSVTRETGLVPFYDGTGYLYASSTNLYDADYANFYTIVPPDTLGSDTTVKYAFPFIAEYGEQASLLAARSAGGLSTVITNFRSIMANLRTAVVTQTLDIQVVSPVQMFDSSTDSSGPGAKQTDKAQATYMVMYDSGDPGSVGGGYEGVWPGGYAFNCRLAHWLVNNYVTDENYSDGFHDVYSTSSIRQETMQLDLLPSFLEINLNHSISISAQRAESRALLTDYLSIVGVGRGEGVWDKDKFLKDINYSASNDSEIVLRVGTGANEMRLQVFRSVGTGAGSGKRNTYIDKTTCTLVRSQPSEDGYFEYQTDGGPLPTYEESAPYQLTYYNNRYPALVTVFPPHYPGGTTTSTTYDNQTYAGSATQESSSVFILDCDTRLRFALGIECHVSVSGSFTSDENGKWNAATTLGSTLHSVRVSIVWWYRGTKRTKDVYTGTVSKPAGLNARLIYAYMSSIRDDPDGTRTLEPLKIKPPQAIYDSVFNARNSQGFSKHYAGFSESDSALGVDTGLEYSYGNTRQTKAMDGMVYRRTIKFSEHGGCDWLFDSTGISVPISNNPFETDPLLTRRYGYSDDLYNLFTTGEVVIELRDGVETPWVDDFSSYGSEPPTCYRV